MKSRFNWIKTWAKAGALAAIAVHAWRCQGRLIDWDGASHLRPALELPLTPFLLLAFAFYKARSRKALAVASILFVVLLPDFRLLRERTLRSELARIPADSSLALPRLKNLNEKYPHSAHVGLLLAELHIAQGNLPATKRVLDAIPAGAWRDDLAPRATHLRYALFKAGLEDGNGNR